MNVFDLSAKLTLDTSEYSGKLQNVASDTEGFSSKLSGGLGKAVKIGGAAIAAGVAAAATGLAAITKQAVNNYAEYEQLVGGVETLFKDSADTVQQYAENAYKTAGLSANEYMSTVTSFSASLLQSLGGDTAQAAQMADLAITDMSDNANKMGTDMEAIQVAYQGFAKQNYTMLDNLKLGYGGTKQEMERLIDDANKLRKAQGLAADLTIDSYADVVEAIHTVQTEMGITGTTAKEASSTIQGSISAMKSSWQNLLTAMADPNADLGKMFDNLVESAGTVIDNLLPVVEQAIGSIGQLIAEGVPKLFERLPEILTTVVPTLISAAISLVSQLVAALPEIIAGLIEAIPMILDAIVQGFAPIVESLGEVFSQAWEFIKNIFAPVGEWFTARKEDIQNAFAAVDSWFSEKFTAARDAVHTAWSAIGSWFGERWADIQSAMQSVNSWFSEKFTSAKDAVHTAWNGIGSFFSEKWTQIKDVFANAKDIFKGIGANIVKGLIAGIGEWIGNAIEKARELIRSVKSAASREAEIASPSKAFRRMGRFIDEGLMLGIDDEEDKPVNAITQIMKKLMEAGQGLRFTSSMSYNASRSSGYSSGEEPMQPIILQVVLDGKVIGETSYNYIKRRTRMVGA